jgi:hypothetical protein
MRYLLIVVVLLVSELKAQNICYVKILEENTEKPIMFVSAQTENTILLADSLGLLNIENNKLSKLFKVSCIGYETKNINTTLQCNDKIYMRPVEILLPESKITYKKGKARNIGYTKKTNFRLSLANGHIVATYIPNNSVTLKMIKKVLIPYYTKGKITSCFRIHLYTCKSDKSPDKDIIEKNLIAFPNKKKGIIEFDISNYNLTIPPEGVLVGVEWINSEKNIDKSVTTNDIVVYLNDKMIGEMVSWERSIRTKSEWKICPNSPMTMNIALEIEEPKN